MRKRIFLAQGLLYLLLGCSLICNAQSRDVNDANDILSTPLWVLTPNSTPAISLSSSDTRTLQYTVLNQSAKRYSLQMRPIPGIQSSGCEYLPSHQSCTLSLTISGSTLQGNVTQGPVLCEKGNGLLCYQPSAANSLAISLVTPPASHFTLGGTVSGLTTAGLILQNNGTNNLPIAPNAQNFQFPAPVPANSPYQVTVLQQPQGLSCAVNNASGTATANVTTITITCSVMTLYAAAQNNSQLLRYTINSDGSLSAPIGGTPLTSPSNITVSPNRNFAYVSAGQGNNGEIFEYRIQPDKSLVSIGNIQAGLVPSQIAITPNSNFLYSTNTGTDSQPGNLYGFSVNSDGRLTADAANPYYPGGSPSAVAVSPNGRFVYMANANNNNIIASLINQTNGALTPIGSPIAIGQNQNPWAIVISPNGSFAYVLSKTTTSMIYNYLIDSNTGALTALADPVLAGTQSQGEALTPNGRFLYVSNSGNNTISSYRVEVSGELTPLTTTMTGQNPISIVVSLDGRFLYVACIDDGTIYAYSIDASGALTPVTGSPFSVPGGPDTLNLAVA